MVNVYHQTRYQNTEAANIFPKSQCSQVFKDNSPSVYKWCTYQRPLRIKPLKVTKKYSVINRLFVIICAGMNYIM